MSVSYIKYSMSGRLRDCLALLFPDVHAAIDWARPPAFLDTELQKVIRAAKVGRRHVDRLVQVWLPNSDDAWLLLHLELQSQQDPGFSERMFIYYYRLYDRYRRQVVGLAVLAMRAPCGDQRNMSAAVGAVRYAIRTRLPSWPIGAAGVMNWRRARILLPPWCWRTWRRSRLGATHEDESRPKSG